MGPFHHAALVLAAGAAGGLLAPAAATTTQGNPPGMHQEDTVARTSVAGAGARLEVAFDPVGERLHVRYRIGNTGPDPLAVFDRGDQHAVLTGRLEVGEVPMPAFVREAGGTVLSHAARPRPHPSPTLPPVPLAARLEPGAILEGAFEFDLSLVEEPRQVRWCLGVAPFDEAMFQAAQRPGVIPVWSGPWADGLDQQLLCTPWFAIDAGRFAQG